MTNDVVEHQQQNMLISENERLRDRAATVYSSKGAK